METSSLSVALVVEGLADEGGTEAQAVAIATEVARRGHRVAVASRWPLEASGERLGRLQAMRNVSIIAPKTTKPSDRLRLSEYNLRRAFRIVKGGISQGRPLSRNQFANDPAILAARNRDVNAILRRKLSAWVARSPTAPPVIHIVGRSATPTLSALRSLEVPIVFSQLGQFGLPSTGWTSERLEIDFCTADSAEGAQALEVIQQRRVAHIPSIGGFAEDVTGLPARVDRFVMVNRFDPVKRIDIPVTAVANLKGIRLDIFGAGPDYIRIRHLIQHLDATRWINLRGHATATEVREALDQAHGFILSSESEGTPTALLEAMSRGRAIVTTAVGGTGDLIRDTQEGLIFDGSSSDLADKIQLLADTPNLGARLGLSARARWAAEFTPAAIGNRYEEVYRRAIRARSGRT